MEEDNLPSIEFYIDPESGEPHIYRHAVSEVEVAEVLAREGLRWDAGEGKFVVVGKTENGRFLQIVLVNRESSGENPFVITAYVPKREVIRAFRRRMKKKGMR